LAGIAGSKKVTDSREAGPALKRLKSSVHAAYGGPKEDGGLSSEARGPSAAPPTVPWFPIAV